MDLSIVIPVKDEAGNIAPLVAEIDAALDPSGVDYEIVYVDDGSSDATAAEIARLQAANRRLRLVRHAKSCGQSAAIRSGVKAARAEWIATLDGDGQNDPAGIPALWQIARAAAARPPLLIAGHRVSRQDSGTKRWSSRLANKIRRAMLHDDTPDTGCGLKLFPRALYLDLPFFNHQHRFLPALVLREGGIVRSLPVNHRPRERGASKYGTWDRLWVGISDLFGVMWLRRRAALPDPVEALPASQPAPPANCLRPRRPGAMSDAKLTESPAMGNLRRTGQALVLGLVIAGIAAAWRWRGSLDPLDLAALVRSYPAAPLVFLALHVVASLTFVPRSFLGFAAGAVFGAWWGLLWAALGSVIGAVAGFLLARYVHAGLFERARWTRFTALLERAERGGWRMVMLIRLVPVIPHSLSNYALGLTRLRLGDYALGSLLGQLPLTIAAVELGVAGIRAMRGTADWLLPTIIGLAALALTVLIPALVRRWKGPGE